MNYASCLLRLTFRTCCNFLLDWGAVLDESGWEKLKSGGLRTPGGITFCRQGKELL
jgi:hypothetical protein